MKNNQNMSTDYHTAQGDFSSIVYRLQPMVLSNFVMWLDLKVAEFKVYGQMLLDGENDINAASWFLRPGTIRDVLPNSKQKERTIINPSRNERLKRIASSTVSRPDSVKQSRIDIGDDDEIVEIKSKSTLPHDASSMMDNLTELQDQLASFFKSSAGPEPSKQPVRMHTMPCHQDTVKKKEQIDTLSSNIPNQKSLKLVPVPLSSGVPQSSSESTLSNMQNVETLDISPQTHTDQSWTVENSPHELSPRLQASDTSDIIIPQSKEVASANVHKRSPVSSPSQSNSISSSSLPLKHSLPATKHSFKHSSPVMFNSNVVVKREPIDEEFEHFESEQKFSPRTQEMTSEAISNSENSLIPESDVSLDTGTETVTKSDGSMYFVSPSDQEGQLSDDKTGQERFLEGEEDISKEWPDRKYSVDQDVYHKSSSNALICYHCNDVFKNSEELQAHLISSGVAIPADIYDHYGRRRRSYSSLKSVHTFEANLFTCNLCCKQFTQKQHYEGHLNTHSGVKPYHCQKCGNSFTYKSRLTMHKRSCGGLTDCKFKCTQCGKSFSKQRYLHDHVKGAHSDHRYTCEYCGQKFMWRSGVQSHKEKRCKVLH